MKTRFVLLVCALMTACHHSHSQPIRIDVAGTGWLTTDLLQVSGASTAYSYVGGAIGFETKVGYLIQSIGFSPQAQVHYHFSGIGRPKVYEVNVGVLLSEGLVASLGMEKSFPVGYSTMGFSLGIGYNWEKYKAEDPRAPAASINNNDIIYFVGWSLYFPFLNRVDATIGYRFLYKAHKVIDQNVTNATYRLDATRAHHLLSLGVSFKLAGSEPNE